MPTRHPSKPEVAPDEPTAPATAYAIERAAPRTDGSLLPNIHRVRLMPLGIEGSVVNISTRGVLILCAKNLRAGTALRVVFEGTGSPMTVPGQVVRSLVSNIGQRGELWYHVGIAFEEAIDLDAAVMTAERAGKEQGAPAERPASQCRFVNRW